MNRVSEFTPRGLFNGVSSSVAAAVSLNNNSTSGTSELQLEAEELDQTANSQDLSVDLGVAPPTQGSSCDTAFPSADGLTKDGKTPAVEAPEVREEVATGSEERDANMESEGSMDFIVEFLQSLTLDDSENKDSDADEKTEEESVKKTEEESVKKTEEESVKKTEEESVKKSEEESVKKTEEESVKKSEEESVKKSEEESVKKTEKVIDMDKIMKLFLSMSYQNYEDDANMQSNDNDSDEKSEDNDLDEKTEDNDLDEKSEDNDSDENSYETEEAKQRDLEYIQEMINSLDNYEKNYEKSEESKPEESEKTLAEPLTKTSDELETETSRPEYSTSKTSGDEEQASEVTKEE